MPNKLIPKNIANNYQLATFYTINPSGTEIATIDLINAEAVYMTYKIFMNSSRNF